MSPRRISLIAAIVVVLGGAIALANPTRLFPNPVAQVPAERKERGEDGWLQDLNLTPDQLQKIQTIRSRYRTEMTQQRQAVQQEYQEMRQMLAGDTPAAKIREQFKQVQAAKQRHGTTRFDSMLEIREVLNLEQRQQLVERMKQRRGGFRERSKERLEP